MCYISKIIIESDAEQFEVVRANWDQTLDHRQELLINRAISTDQYLSKYPVFKLPQSYTLVNPNCNSHFTMHLKIN